MMEPSITYRHTTAWTTVKPGERFTFAVNSGGLQFFDPSSGESIWGA
jgi:hypothetical protein